MRSTLCIGIVLCVLAVLAGCGTFRETLPERSATEQLLLSTATDRAVDRMSEKVGDLTGKAIFVELGQLDAYDKAYVVERAEKAILDNGGSLAGKAEDANMILRVASGALSIDKNDWLFGIPSIPLPIPQVGTVETPTIAIFRIIRYRGKAKLLFNAVDAETKTKYCDIPICYGRAKTKDWWVILLGPFRTSNVPE